MNFNELFGSVPDGWRSCTLGELVKEFGGGIQTGPFGSQLHAADYVENGIPSIMPKNIRIDGVDDSDIARVSPEDIERLSKYKVQTGDIVYSRRGDVEKCSLITELEDGWLCGTGCLRVRLQSKQITPEFLHAYLCHPYVREWIVRHAVGATMPNLNTSILSALPVLVPTSGAMNSITNNWSALSQKMVVNVKINHTLEEMAQAIFKSWFVDFDPVKAKMKGQQPEGMDAATASLFPEKLVESELGLIPEGWEVKPFSEWVKITKGKNITKKTIVEGDIPVVAGGLKPAYFHNTHNVNGPAITISASGANAGFVNLYFENIWASDCSYISQSATSLFFLPYVALKYNQKKIFDMQTGAAQPHIYPRDFERLMITVPNDELCAKLEGVFVSFFGTVANNKQQNIELSALRDTLLPKLLSGEIELDSVVAK